MPGAENTALGFWSGEEFPLPKSHDQPVGDPVDVSVNLTASGKQPVVTSAVKSATWAVATHERKTNKTGRQGVRGRTDCGA